MTFILGLCVGSFLNAVIFRVYEGESALRGRSKCRSCEEPLGLLDLVPIVSFLLLRGRCRRCKASVSWQYPLVEFSTALLFLLFYVRDGRLTYALFGDWILLAFLVVIFVYDLRHMLILDRFTIPAMVIAAVLNLWTGEVGAGSMLLGATAIGGFFYVQFALSQGVWIGGGDIRLGALMGFTLGLQRGLVALFIAYLLGAVIGVILLATKRAEAKTPLPFGTFLTLSTAVLLYWGDVPIKWYLSLFS